MKQAYQPDPFHITPVADGVFAALAIAGSGAWCNAGIIDLGEQTLVFDTLFTPHAAHALRRYAEQLTGRPVTWVANSHCHSDHMLGNQVFADAQIVSTETTRALAEHRLSALVAQGGAESSLAEMAAQIDQEPDARVRVEMTATLADQRMLADALPTIALRLPDVCFAERMVFHGTRRRAELLAFSGHTASDAVLWLPDDRVLFAGDIVQVRTHPSIGDGDLAAWQRSLDQLALLDIGTLVPGHGPLGTHADLVLIRQYIQDLQRSAANAGERGQLAQHAEAMDVLAPYTDWAARSIFEDNQRFVRQHARQHTN